MYSCHLFLISSASVQFSLVTQSCLTLCSAMDCSMPGLPVHHQLPQFMETNIHLVMPSNRLILCCPLLLLPSNFPRIRVFSNESVPFIRWPKYWSFRFNISPSNEYSGLISFRIHWLYLLAVQGTLKSLLQHQQGESYLSNKESEAPRAFNTFQSGGNRRWFQEQVASLDSWYRELFLDVVRRVRCWQQGWVWWDLGRDGER